MVPRWGPRYIYTIDEFIGTTFPRRAVLNPIRDDDEPAELSESFLRRVPPQAEVYARLVERGEKIAARDEKKRKEREEKDAERRRARGEGPDVLELCVVDSTQFILQVCAFFSLLFANVLQHVVHPSLDVFKDAAVELRGPDWEADFYVRDANDWTPPHEVMSQRMAGKFIFLTVQVLLLQLVYYFSCIASYVLKVVAEDELLDTGAYKAYVKLYGKLHVVAPIVDGLGVLVYLLFFVFAVIMDFFEPKWRGQWDYIEQNMPSLCQKHGVLVNGGVCSHYGVFIHVLHAPCLIGAVLDILAKRHALRERALSAATMGILAEGRTLSAALSAKLPMFSPRELLLYLTAYHIFFQSWLGVNYLLNKGAIPYPWYYDMNPPFSLAFAIYFFLVNTLIYFVVRAVHHLLTPVEIKPPVAEVFDCTGCTTTEEVLNPPFGGFVVGEVSTVRAEEVPRAFGMVSTPQGQRSARRRQRPEAYAPQ